MPHSNAYDALCRELNGGLTNEQRDSLYAVRSRMGYELEDLVRSEPDMRYWSALGTYEDIDRLQRAFPAIFGPEVRHIEDLLPAFTEGC